MDTMTNLLTAMLHNKVIELVVLAVVMDTIFGVIRAIKYRKFNSCVGIDGAIRKVSMLTSLVFLAVVDHLVSVNLIGFIPEELRSYLPECLGAIGLAEFFGILYLGYETVSILKNMTLCGLPVKKLWEAVRTFLGKYTTELPDTEEQDKMARAQNIATATDDVPPGALDENEDGNSHVATVNVYDEDGNVAGSISKENADALAAAVDTVITE